MAKSDDFNNFKLKLSSKKLHSGRHQIKFEVKHAKKRSIYGYLLAEPKSSLREVVEKILNRFYFIQEKDLYYHGHLYSMLNKKNDDEDMMVFENPPGGK